jgi:hypothetical protein
MEALRPSPLMTACDEHDELPDYFRRHSTATKLAIELFPFVDGVRELQVIEMPVWTIPTLIAGSERHHGVYLLCHGWQCIYVGQTGNLRLRIAQHLTGSGDIEVKHFSWVIFIPRPALLLLDTEAVLIKALSPALNQTGRFSRYSTNQRLEFLSSLGEPDLSQALASLYR